MSNVMALGQCYLRRFPDRSQPILLVGLRTSGSYLRPCCAPSSMAEGYEKVSLLTLVPAKARDVSKPGS